MKQNNNTTTPFDERVTHLDTSVLTKTQNKPLDFRQFLRFPIVISSAIGLIVVCLAFYFIIIAPANNQKTISDNCNRIVNYNYVLLLDLVGKSDEEISDIALSKGAAVDILDEGQSGVDLQHIPSSADEQSARELIAKGFNNLSAVDLALMLNGSWRLTVTHETDAIYRIRYADFSSGTLDASINSAISHQGFSGEQITSEGKDDNGNTYKEGTITIGEDAYIWRVSCISLEEVYSEKLINNSYYVGIKLTKSTEKEKESANADS